MRINKGIMSEETREKLRQANLGEKNPMFGKLGKDNPNFGIPLSDDRKQKISETCKIARSGTGSSSATEYHLIDPSGQLHIVKGGLEQFCYEHNLSEKLLRKYADRGVIPVSNYKSATEKSKNTAGWQFSKIGIIKSK